MRPNWGADKIQKNNKIQRNFLINSDLGVDFNIFSNKVKIFSVVILHTIADGNDSSKFLIVFHRIFNTETLKKQFDYTFLLTNISKY